MSQFRMFVKSRTNLIGKSISNANSKVSSFNIKRDLLSKASSTIEVMALPTAIDNGDIIGIYDETGRVIYNGVVKSISENTIQCGQMVEMFADTWLYRTGEGTTFEDRLKEIIDTDFRNNEDIVISSAFENFNVTCSTSTTGEYPTEKEHTTKDFSSWIYKIYENYDVIVDMNVAFNEGVSPTIQIGKNEEEKITIADNAISVLSVTPTSEVTSTNKVIIYSKDGVYRETWYASPSGITNNPNQLDRLKTVKTKIVFSDDEIETIKEANLQSDFYNHKIVATLSLNSKLYNFWDFTLGGKFNIIYRNTYYDTILTGYELRYDGYTMPEVNLTFGKVRINLENKIYRIIHGQDE